MSHGATFMPDINTLLYALLGGLLPALLWLWFWLREDAKHPEPRWLIASTFFAGIAIVPIALFAEQAAALVFSGTFLISVWAAIEEVLKFGAAYFVAFKSIDLKKNRLVDEPIDPLIYMITAALGFAAIENTLFLFGPLDTGDFFSGILTGNLRFLGATVLHTVASAAIGAAMGFTFYKSAAFKRIAFVIGLCTAIALHALFNFFILITEVGNTFFVFGIVWLAALALLAVFEKIKRVRRIKHLKIKR